jgi:hypothetical protein
VEKDNNVNFGTDGEQNNEEKFGTVQNYDCGISGEVLGKYENT